MIDSARLLMIKARAQVTQNREDKMARLKAEERDVINKRIQKMFKEDGYTDKAVVEALYKEDGLEVSPASICIYRNELGLSSKTQGRPKSKATSEDHTEAPKKRKYTRRVLAAKDDEEATDSEEVVTLDTIDQALSNISELLKLYRKQQKERLAALL